MRPNKIFLFSALLLLAACRDPGPTAQGVDEVDSSPLATAAVEKAKATVEQKTTFVTPVAGAISALPFSYHVSVDREVAARGTGEKSGVVGIEFLDTSVADANSAMAAEFEKAGFEVASSEKQGNAIRSVYTKEGHGDVLVWVRPGAPRGERYALQMPEAKGTIYLAYPLND